MAKTVSAREARNGIGALIHHVNTEDEEVIVTNHGKPRAVLISFDNYENIRLMLMQKRKLDAMHKIQAYKARTRARRIPRS